MDALMRATLVALYGETAVAKLEAAQAEQEELQRIADDLEAARFAAEIERDAALGNGADWPDA
jgi:hypothetical protein